MTAFLAPFPIQHRRPFQCLSLTADLELRPGIPDDEPRNAHAHLQALLLGHQATVSVCNGALQLGRYQDVILVELDGPRQRTVALQWLSA